MTETRLVPSGKVYRHIFDAQTHLSLSLHETRRRRVANAGYLSEGDPTSRDMDTGTSEHLLSSQQCSGDMTARNQLFSKTGLVRSKEQDDYEEIQGLPDNVVPAKTGSDIIERLMEKRQRDHMETVADLQRDLIVLSKEFEKMFIQTGEDFLLKLAEHDKKVETLVQKIENNPNSEALIYQDWIDFWNTVSHECIMRRKYIHELGETFVRYEIDRASMISDILKKYTMKLEKISYMMSCNVHKLIDNETMMINQALLANKKSMAKLHLNLMEKDLQKEVLYHLRWEGKIQDWNRIIVIAAINKFKDFMNTPEIQTPQNVQDSLNTMHSTQKVYSEQRLSILEQMRNMTPPTCSMSHAAEWYSSLSTVNEQIDCMHIDTMINMRKYYEATWQSCLPELQCFKDEVLSCGLTSDEIQENLNAELLPLIGKCQTQAEERLAAIDKAFKTLAMTSAAESKSLYKFVYGAAQLWEEHSAALQGREKQLQSLLDQVRIKYEQDNQKKEAQLDVLLDKLRQENTEQDLKAALKKALKVLEEVKNGYVTFYQKALDTMENYPAMVLEDLYTYSSAVCKYFDVREVFIQDPEELQMRYPSFDHGQEDDVKTIHVVNLLDSPITEADPDISSEEFETYDTFTTLRGNVYKCKDFAMQLESEANLDIVEVEPVLFPKSLMVELQKVVRDGFFNHLEEKFQAVLNNTLELKEAKTEELKSELNLHLQLHQPRAKGVKLNIHNVRAAELTLHQDRVNRHCRGILEAVDDFRILFNDHQVKQQTLNEDFRSKISSMEDTSTTITKSDKLVKLSDSLQTSLHEHVTILKKSQREFRHSLEHKFRTLRRANGKLLKSFKLFSEGGNFTPKEIEVHQKRLEKTTKQIDTADEALMQDMETVESNYMEQAQEIINKSEDKIMSLIFDLMFQEKIQKNFTSIQVKIKGEILKSNMQTKRINTIMSELEEMLNTYNQHDLGTGAVTSDSILKLISSLTEELRKRCQYLDCFLDPAMIVPHADSLLQGAFGVAARSRIRKHDMLETPESLLQPSRMGVAFIDDVAVEVIQGLHRISKYQPSEEVDTSPLTVPFRLLSLAGSSPMSAKCQLFGDELLCIRSSDSVTSTRVKRITKPNRFEKRFQVFGSKPEGQHENLTFKGCITIILWDANDTILQMAEDYYKKKNRRHVTFTQEILDSFEHCAEELNRRVLVYKTKTEGYHSKCVQEFYLQLKTLEQFVCQIPEGLLTKVRDQHSEDLKSALTLIDKQFETFYQQSEQQKREHSSKICIRLSHPACAEELKTLITAEENRQKELKKIIQDDRLQQQICIKNNANEFVTALATMTENLLFQMDSILSTNDLQSALIQPMQQSITNLIRQMRTGGVQEDKKESRTWPGIHYFQTTETTDDDVFNQQPRKTASITTAKVKMGHIRAIEIRNALHQNYKHRVMEELEKVEKTSREREMDILRWQERWKDQIRPLSTHSSG